VATKLSPSSVIAAWRDHFALTPPNLRESNVAGATFFYVRRHDIRQFGAETTDQRLSSLVSRIASKPTSVRTAAAAR
jgi:hypothetical protein